MLLIACAEVGGASMVKFKLELTRGARADHARAARHARAGRACATWTSRSSTRRWSSSTPGLRLFHLHAEGMGLVIIVTTMTAATLVESVGARRAIILLLTVGGAAYPFGYLLWSALIPYYGIQTGKAVAEWLVWIPFGGRDHRGGVVARVDRRLAGRRARASRIAGMRRSGRSAAPRPAAGRRAALLLAAAAPAAGHHVGAYVPRDNEVSANFKQLKFSIQARKLDVAAAALRERRDPGRDARAPGRLPAGLEETTRAALAAGDGPRAERRLMVFFAVLIRDLALEADRRLADAREPAPARGRDRAASSSRRSGATTTWSTSRSASTIPRPRWPSAWRSTRRRATPRAPRPRRQRRRETLSLRSRDGCPHVQWRRPPPRRCASRSSGSRAPCRG